MTTTRRQQRISELLREELSIMILELIDARLEDAMVSVTRVDVSPDLHNARVYVEHQLPAGETRQVLASLHRAANFLRRGLVERTDLRYVPELNFAVDDSAERARRIEELLNTIIEHPQAQENNESDDSE